MVKIAAQVALDTPPMPCAWQVRNAMRVEVSRGRSSEFSLPLRRRSATALAPKVGDPKLVTAKPEIVRAVRRTFQTSRRIATAWPDGEGQAGGQARSTRGDTSAATKRTDRIGTGL
jgi:hypothetical protein